MANFDIVFASMTGCIGVMLGNGNGTFQAVKTYACGNGPRGIAVADLSGDGKVDIAVCNKVDNTISVLLGNGDGTFQHQTVITDAQLNQPWQVAVADVNGDGKPDLTVTQYGGGNRKALVFLNNGNGTFQTPALFSYGYANKSLAVVDINGDGKEDIVLSDWYRGSVFTILGNGDGTFQHQVEIHSIGTHAYFLNAVDVSGDGAIDLIVGNPGSSTISVILGNGNGTFKPKTDLAATAATGMVTTDITGDGKPDIVAINGSGSGNLMVFLGNGNGTFQGLKTFPIQHYSYGLAVADINGDGKPDVVTTGYNYHLINVLLGNGNGSFQSASTITTTGLTPHFVVLAKTIFVAPATGVVFRKTISAFGTGVGKRQMQRT